MLMLSKENFERAARFIADKGRPLEKALFNYQFNSGNKETVLFELAKFQNEDGGFGHGLESDVRLKASNCFTTSVAFQVLVQLGVDADNEIVKCGINYLVANYKPEFKGWLPFPKEVEEEPRAIWWNYFSNEENKYNPNPSSEIAGYLAKYSKYVPSKILSESLEEALKSLEENSSSLDMHDIYCYQRMANCISIEQRERVMALLRGRLREVIEFDSNQWTGYAARPLNFVKSPDYELASEITEEEIAINLDYLIKEQSENGSWVPRWHWGRFEEEWEKAKVEWMGVITLENLRILKAFDKIEK